MTTMTTSPPTIDTLADLLERLGGISPQRVRFHPLPGTATEEDVIAIERREKRLCELVDGVLVEKAMGYRESLLACALIEVLRAFVRPRNLGLVSGADGMMRLFPGLVRIPDVAFASWDRIPNRRVPTAPIPELAPDLAVEILSEGNTEAEMARKRREYFEAGVRLVWLVDPEARTVSVYTAPEQATVLDATQTLDGGVVLPGFTLPLAELFAELDRQAKA
jgi:Uma2 family endonuclease